VTVEVLLNVVATTWLLAMLPGVGQTLMLRQTFADGPRIAVATTFGTVAGLVIWSAAAGAGALRRAARGPCHLQRAAAGRGRCSHRHRAPHHLVAGVFAITLLPAFAGVGGFLPTLGVGIAWAVVTACWYLPFACSSLEGARS
jgi:hypothetical protein